MAKKSSEGISWPSLASKALSNFSQKSLERLSVRQGQESYCWKLLEMLTIESLMFKKYFFFDVYEFICFPLFFFKPFASSAFCMTCPLFMWNPSCCMQSDLIVSCLPPGSKTSKHKSSLVGLLLFSYPLCFAIFFPPFAFLLLFFWGCLIHLHSFFLGHKVFFLSLTFFGSQGLFLNSVV